MNTASPASATAKPPPLTPQAPANARLPLILRLLGLVPLSIASLCGSLLGIFAWVASPGYRRKLATNMQMAGYGPGSVRRQAIIEAGRMVAECPYIWTRQPRQISRKMFTADTDPIEAAERRGKGVLILTPHLGSFEMGARYYAGRRPITVLFKPPKIDLMRRWLIAARAVEGIEAVPPTVGGVRTMLRTLRRGDIVGLLPDQVPTAGDGIWVPFFGQPAYTMTLPQRLVEMTDCTVVLAMVERLAGGRGWRIHFESLDEAPTPEVINKNFERLIRRMPEQYIWGYNRYKRLPGMQDDRNADLLKSRHSRREARRQATAGTGAR